MNFVKVLEIDAFEELTKFAVGFVPTSRSPFQSELRHLQDFLSRFAACEVQIRQVLLKHLTQRKQQLNTAKEIQRLVNAVTEEEREPFFAEVLRLSLAFTGNKERNKEFVHTLGSLMGLTSKQLKGIENQVESENIKRLHPDGA